jgi:hypothetical protein
MHSCIEAGFYIHYLKNLCTLFVKLYKQSKYIPKCDAEKQYIYKFIP